MGKIKPEWQVRRSGPQVVQEMRADKWSMENLLHFRAQPELKQLIGTIISKTETLRR